MGIALGSLDRAELPAARTLLAAACAYDRADIVAEEKLFGAAPSGDPQVWSARIGGALAGIAVTAPPYVRLLAVHPGFRGAGVGSALLGHAEDVLRGVGRARLVGQPGNFLAPGIDERNAETIAWLVKRGWLPAQSRNVNLLVDAHVAPPKVIAGYTLQRATIADLPALTAAVAAEFGGSWPFEIARAIAVGGVHLAIAEDATVAAFAVHDGNNQGLGWFGPAGTWPAHRGRGLGEALLRACLHDIARDHAVCEVAWIGPRRFYERVVTVTGERRFVPMSKEL